MVDEKKKRSVALIDLSYTAFDINMSLTQLNIPDGMHLRKLKIIPGIEKDGHSDSVSLKIGLYLLVGYYSTNVPEFVNKGEEPCRVELYSGSIIETHFEGKLTLNGFDGLFDGSTCTEHFLSYVNRKLYRRLNAIDNKSVE